MKLAQRIKRMIYLFLQYGIERNENRNRQTPESSEWGLPINQKQHLMIGGCDCVELAREYGTPLFVVDKKLLEINYLEFRSALASHSIDFQICYSYKTNPVPAVLKVLHDQGAGAEVISPYELWLAIQLGVKPDAIVYNGPNKSDEGLRLAITSGIKLINANSFAEIEKLEALAVEYHARPSIGVRVSTRAGWGAQFGFKLETGEARQAFEQLHKSRVLEPLAIHMHLGTNLKTTHAYETAILEILGFMSELKEKCGIHIKYLDLGGGFGVPTVRGLGKRENRLNTSLYKPFEPPAMADTPSIGVFIRDIVSTVQNGCKTLHMEPPILLFEPGRALTSNTEILLSRVGDFKKTRNSFKIALLDAGVNIGRPMSWEYHEIFLANRMQAVRNERYGLAGPICTPMDLFLTSKRLPLLEIGDLLAIMDAGAYFTSFANDFSFPRPCIIMASDGAHWTIRRRGTYDDLIARDIFR